MFDHGTYSQILGNMNGEKSRDQYGTHGIGEYRRGKTQTLEKWLTDFGALKHLKISKKKNNSDTRGG